MNSQLERNKAILKKYIPEKAVEPIAKWIYHFDFKLKIKRSRTTKYGDYRPPVKEWNHQITINNDLNPYSFLITLVHEIAHLSNWNKNKENVKPHGEEWKKEFKLLMKPFLTESIFPDDVIFALNKYLHNPYASSCTDLNLQRTLKSYNQKQKVVYLEQLPHGSLFKTSKKKYFYKGKRIRKRYICTEMDTKKQYLFSPIAEIIPVEQPLLEKPKKSDFPSHIILFVLF